VEKLINSEAVYAVLELYSIKVPHAKSILFAETYLKIILLLACLRLKPSKNQKYLLKQKFPPDVITKTNIITDDILDHLENPTKNGQWLRRGMVVGNVQSGKTANYTGVVCKAADSGYKVIIILAGLLNSLRNQTQSRIDLGFIGKCSHLKKIIGVGNICNKRHPAFFTTSVSDFRKNTATSLGIEIGQLNETAVFVVKKNKNSLENLVDWLKHNNQHGLKDMPMLLIDDEADHASINTNSEDNNATAINSKIRELLKLFGRASYVGYTATPFANIFIDPDSTDEMLGDDLFPRDFILNLDAPSNYFGPDYIFSGISSAEKNIKIIDDNEDFIPVRHKKDDEVIEIPSSLKEAIACFVLVKTIRLLRGHVNKHHSMMINVSRFTRIQTIIKQHVFEFISQMRDSIICNYALSSQEAMQNSDINFLFKTWVEEYSNCGFVWNKIQSALKEAIATVEVIEVNSSSTAKPLDYDKVNYPDGRSIIAVGGLALSRGLTLEGLSVSYFLRNSKMYDTLMQMGRWFGYRDGYKDLCRIFLREEATSWYTHIAGVLAELRDEFKKMKIAGMTPSEFGLCVRSHPASLIVTARNKMRSSTTILRQVSLEGRLIETSILSDKEKALEANRELLRTTIESLKSNSDYYNETNTSGYTWKRVPFNIITEFVSNFANHHMSQLTSSLPVNDYIKHLANSGCDNWDVCLISPKKSLNSTSFGKIQVHHQKRTSRISDGAIWVNKGKRRVGYAIQEAAGLDKNIVDQTVMKFKNETEEKKTVSGSLYRQLRKDNPLLLLHIIDCYEKNGDDEELVQKGVAAYSISFPGSAGSHRPQKLVEYEVNTVWWKNEFEQEEEEIDYE
jgi:hypothetical protein